MACFCPLLWTSTQDEGVLVCTLQLSWKNWIYSRAVVNILPIRIGHKDILTAPKELTYPPPSGHWGAEETAGDWREKAAGGNKLGSLKATPYHDPRMNMSTRSFEIFFSVCDGFVAHSQSFPHSCVGHPSKATMLQLGFVHPTRKSRESWKAGGWLFNVVQRWPIAHDVTHEILKKKSESEFSSNHV